MLNGTFYNQSWDNDKKKKWHMKNMKRYLIGNGSNTKLRLQDFVYATYKVWWVVIISSFGVPPLCPTLDIYYLFYFS